MATIELQYRVGDLRKAGLDAKWGRQRNGGPILLARDPNASQPHQRDTWWKVGRDMFEAMKEQGVREAFDGHTILGKYFSI